MSLPKNIPARNAKDEQPGRVAVLRSAHGRPGATFCTSASFIVSSTGARLLAGRHITKRAESALTRNAQAFERDAPNVRPFPRRTSHTGTDRRAA